MQFPRVKSEHLPFRTPHGTVRIGGEIYGLAAEIRDPHDWVATALDLMDGRRTPPDITRCLLEHFAGLSATQADGLLTALLATGYIEDAVNDEPATPSGSEADRYSRNLAYFRRVDLRPGHTPRQAQNALARSRVLVLGLGGTGSHAAWALAAAGIGAIHCVDHDRVEASNLTRQVLYTEADIGRPKAQAAAERLRSVNSQARITFEHRAVTDERQLDELLAGFDILALCADEPDSESLRGWVSKAAVRAGVPWVGGGYNGPLVTVGVFTPEGPCFPCLAAGEEALLPAGPPPRLGGQGVIAPSAGISGQLVANEVIALLTGISRTRPGFIRGINLIAPDDLVYVRHPALPDCPTCNRPPVLPAGPLTTPGSERP
ncbi:hypothetical protein GCM10010430_73250 [Kitasatospora cystarginea]|uniref:THIF-type NAD/FAD binding fold domain-containing protein n=1 Tax=Kitasatospora cystarginea TaxID=58350 RepID=A0ABN3EYX5_9ACTN